VFLKSGVSSLSIQRILEFFQPGAQSSGSKARVVLARHDGDTDSISDVRAAVRRISHHLVSRTCGISESSYRIYHDHRGAPRIDVDDPLPPMSISVSHSHDWIAVGLSKGVQIGIDVEPTRPRERRVEISELLGWQLEVADDDDFHAKWTLWEASTKCASGSVVERSNIEFESLCDVQQGTIAEAGHWKTFSDQLGDLFFAVAMLDEHGEPGGTMMHRDLDAATMTRW
jgi:phosphopantetheinyl transferase